MFLKAIVARIDQFCSVMAHRRLGLIGVAVQRAAPMMQQAANFAPVQLHLQDFIRLRHPPVWGNDIDWIVSFDDHPTAVIRCRDVRCVTPIGRAFPDARLFCVRDPDFDDSGWARNWRIRICPVGPYEQFIAVSIQGYILMAKDMR